MNAPLESDDAVVGKFVNPNLSHPPAAQGCHLGRQ